MPYKLIGKEVDIRATEKTVEIYYRRQRQASHIRSDAPGRHSTQQDHMPPAHQVVAGWSPERFERWAEEIGPQTKAFITLLLNSRRHPQQAYRSCLGILGLGKQYSHERLEAACAWALTAGIHSYSGVNNILKHNMDRLERDEPPATVLPAHANIRGQSYYS